MILIEKYTGRRINTSELEKMMSNALKEIKDERIVKPKRFKISEIDTNGTLNGIFIYGCEDIDERVESYNGKVLWSRPKFAEGEAAGYDAVFKPITPEVTELVHQAPIYYISGKGTSYVNMSNLFVSNRVIGDPKFRIKNRLGAVIGGPTYLKMEGTDERDFLGGGNEFYTHEDLTNGQFKPHFAYWDFNISVQDLLKTRTVFYDPEGVDTTHEFKRTFMVFGGIPIQAIKNARIVVK